MNWFSIQTVAQIWVEHILNALPEGFLIAIFAWVLLRVLRRQNSGTRFAVWFLALLSVATLPVLGGFGEGRGLMTAGMSSGITSGMASANSWGSLRPAITIPGRWALVVFVAWALGTSVAMMRLLAGLWRLRRLRRNCTPIVAADLDPAVRKTVEAIGAGPGVSKSNSESITIATSEYVRVPAAIGFWKRTIVLPAWTLRELPSQDLNVILLHEFAHLQRWDDWTNLIQKIVRALFFFHPAVWWIEKRISVEREMACDDAVLAETANPHGYATCLVSLLEKNLAHRIAQRLTDKRWSMAQAAVHRAREASLRLAQILDKNRPGATRVWKPALGMVGVFSVVCLMALPHAPQFVAFDRGTLAGNSDAVYSAAP
jgi:beta-lactamase regulating signal transducer with metallopeptidase domain